MDSLNASDRLRTIVDFLRHFPTREQLVVFLSSGVCPFGEVVGVCTGYLDNDGNINFEFSHGFNDLSHQKLKVHISADDPTAETLRSMKTKVMNLHTVFKQYPKVIAPAGIADYGTGVGFPTTSRRIYIFAFVDEIERFENMSEYFECLRSILTFWETLQESRSIKEVSKPKLLEAALTQRQERILELINNGKTNAMIAVHLGYSESLIRQETIIIYRKLGVDGRRELKRSVAS